MIQSINYSLIISAIPFHQTSIRYFLPSRLLVGFGFCEVFLLHVHLSKC